MSIDLDDTIDTDLARCLREWRHEQAHQLSIPPYWILTNATMAAIASRRPRSLEELTAIPGMGKTRAEKYGEQILEMVAEAAGRPVSPVVAPPEHRLAPATLRPKRLQYALPEAQQEAFLKACGLSSQEVDEMLVEVVLRH
ncbi:MAG: HRDC domain-containing protein [Candidatus Xenobia bacterium]